MAPSGTKNPVGSLLRRKPISAHRPYVGSLSSATIHIVTWPHRSALSKGTTQPPMQPPPNSGASTDRSAKCRLTSWAIGPGRTGGSNDASCGALGTDAERRSTLVERGGGKLTRLDQVGRRTEGVELSMQVAGSRPRDSDHDARDRQNIMLADSK